MMNLNFQMKIKFEQNKKKKVFYLKNYSIFSRILIKKKGKQEKFV